MMFLPDDIVQSRQSGLIYRIKTIRLNARNDRDTSTIDYYICEDQTGKEFNYEVDKAIEHGWVKIGKFKVQDNYNECDVL